MKIENEFNQYFSGKKLYGDDFSADEIFRWYQDEQEAYTNLYARKHNYSYDFHSLNVYHGYSRLPKKRYKSVLGLGSAGGDEFFPIIHEIDRLVIVEPSDYYSNVSHIKNTPVSYIKPSVDGRLKFSDKSFELITSFGVLHHIANVSYVIKECGRVLEPGGYMLIREPITSMGDWRKARKGLTRRERGIPLNLLIKSIEQANMQIDRKALCFFSPTNRLMEKMGINPVSNTALVILDNILCNLFKSNYSYHATSFVKKIRPSCVYIIAKKLPD